MNAIFQDILNFLLPPRCMCCGNVMFDDNGVCPECFNQITFISAPYCAHCGLPFTDPAAISNQMLCPHCLQEKRHIFRMQRAAVKYDYFSKKAILALKFMDKTDNAKVFAKWLKLAGKDIFDTGADLLVPVPLHYTRLIKRRYNQSALLAKELSLLTGVRTDALSLVKTKATKPQARFSNRNSRINNVKGVFKVKRPENIKNKRIVLIDDVFTTGSTARECAKALLAAGAQSVDVLTVAKVYF